jgi:uncharacterized damage-inducible protein DinB
MTDSKFGTEFLKELDSETASSRKCLERIPESLFGWKPHERSMTMGYLALLVAEIPKWLSAIIEIGEINFATFQHFQPKTTSDLVKHFDENLKGAREALQRVSDQTLISENFSLKNGEQLLLSSPKKENVSQTINHLVHHRGQLTIYMRLNNIPVPSIYGPSADDRTF